MKKPLRFVILGTVFMLLLMIAPARAASVSNPIESNWFNVKATHAEYLDIDSDGMEDDILTSFDITILDANMNFKNTYVYCYLFQPSGNGYAVAFMIIGHYTYLSISLKWYNTVTETGWYTFVVYTEIPVNQHTYYSLDGISFDPPTGGDPGPPLVEIAITNSTEA